MGCFTLGFFVWFSTRDCDTPPGVRSGHGLSEMFAQTVDYHFLVNKDTVTSLIRFTSRASDAQERRRIMFYGSWYHV